jgi:hypothetical protein
MKKGEHIMERDIYLNFSDLSEDAKDRILAIARENIIAEEGDDIREEFGEDMFDTVVAEKAEEELYNMNFIFNV